MNKYYVCAAILLSILAMAVTPAMAERILLVPVEAIYYEGCDVCASTEDDADFEKKEIHVLDCEVMEHAPDTSESMLLAELATSVFENIQSGIIQFNNMPEVRRRGLSYHTMNYGLPHFSHNRRLDRFYTYLSGLSRERKRSKFKLLHEKRRADVIVWGRFSFGNLDNLKTCLEQPDQGRADIGLTLYISKNGDIISRSLDLIFLKKYYELSGKSLLSVRNQIADYLVEVHELNP